MTKTMILSTLKGAGSASLLLGFLLFPMSAQDHEATVFRSIARLVQLNVVVVDNHNQPITDLSADDFQVFDNGREQKLVHFSRALPIAFDHAQLPPTVITNRPQGQVDATGSVTAILVDELIDQDVLAVDLRSMLQSARLQILKFLSTLQPGEQVALYALRPEGLVVLHDFTDDPAVLVDAATTLTAGLLKSTTPTSAGGPSVPPAQQVHDWLAGSNRGMQPSYASVRASSNNDLHRVMSGNAFVSIARHLQGIRGRKNVVWISTAFSPMVTDLDIALMAQERNTILPNAWGPSQPVFASTESHAERLRSFAQFLSNTNLAVYPIDPRGVSEPLALSGGAADRPSSAGAPPPVIPSIGPFFRGPWSAMDLIASETGGRAFYDRNGLDHLLREVVDENHVTYTLGYYPGSEAWDGKYHHMVVKLKRSGLTVRCRKGYYAVDEPMRKPDTALRQAARSTLDGAGLGVTLTVPSNPLAVGSEEVVLRLNPADIEFQQSDGRWNAKLDIVFAGIAKDGRVLRGTQDHLALALRPDTYEHAASRGWFYRKTVSVDAKAERLRVIVRDVSTGSTGSVSVPVSH